MSALDRYQWTLAWCIYVVYLMGVYQYFEAVR